MHSDSTSADGWYLLGLIREARGDDDALECYRKALYLNPRHYETLLQMALLAEKEGNKTEAARLFREALRIFEKLGAPEAESARICLARVDLIERREE